jgi:nitroreductase/NAD-dependent dihydropyrimidine dehydrogenase PreA subunit
MPLLNINKDKCLGDGKCVSVCPVHILYINQISHLPEVSDGKEELCLNCGHCVAVCPPGALSLVSMPARSCEALEAGWRLDPKAVGQLLKGRRSIRAYKETPVTGDTLEKLIDIARYAPSGINRQPVRWAIIDDARKVQKLAGLIVEWMRGQVKEGSELAESFRFEGMVNSWDKGHDNILRGAPAMVIAYALKDDPMARDASTIALTYFDIASPAFGLGTCWAGYAQMAINMSPEVRKFLGLPGRTYCFGAMMVGYPKFEYFRIPLRNKPHIKKI